MNLNLTECGNFELVYTKYSISLCTVDRSNIYYKHNNGFQAWSIYDDNGNEIYYKTSKGFESWVDYEDGAEIHYKEVRERWYNSDRVSITQQEFNKIHKVNDHEH